MAAKRLAIVEWKDTVGFSRWTNVPHMEATGLGLIRSVGWIHNRDKEVLRLVASYDDSDNCEDANIIPRSTITKITYLEDPHDK